MHGIWSKPYTEKRGNRSPRGRYNLYMAEIYALR